jgi:hypothetical protein
MSARAHATMTAALLLALVFLTGLAGCASPSTGNLPDSQLSFDRTYDLALAAMADQRLIFSAQDRRQGRIVGSTDGVTIIASIEPIVDGTTRVSFTSQGNGAADAALLARVTEAYNTRMSKLGIVGGFKDSGGSNRPVPCPSGPAFCP